MSIKELTFRKIQVEDDLALADVIKTSLIEQGNAVDGTVFTDDATNHMSTCYTSKRSIYYTVHDGDELLGGCGINQLPGEGEDVCELQRLFIKSKVRGNGIGAKLVEMCIQFAKEAGYRLIYLETFPNMIEAVGLYEKYGFKYIDQAMGNTGHFYCTTRMVLNI